MGWKTHDTRIVFENNWMTVREDRVTNPGAGQNQYGHVQFKNVAVAVLPIDHDGYTRLVGQSRYTLGRYSWELPMGGAPLDEDPLAAAKRELKEETGLIAGKWSELMRLNPSNSITDELGIVYVARDLTDGMTSHEETEDIQTLQEREADKKNPARGRVSSSLYDQCRYGATAHRGKVQTDWQPRASATVMTPSWSQSMGSSGPVAG